MSRHPEVKWAQRLDKVFITVQLPDAKDVKVNLEPDGVFIFNATAGADHSYELKLDLFDKVNVEESKINNGLRSIFCVVEKAEKAWWKKLLRGDEKTPHYIKVDWDKWVDEDEDNGPQSDFDMGGMDFSKFGGMDGMGMGGMGMGGMGGMGMGGMGMPGMGGMGMGEGMGDDFDESDDEDEEAEKTETAEKGEAAFPEAKMAGAIPEAKTEAAPST